MKLHPKTLIIAGAVAGAMTLEAVVLLLLNGGQTPTAAGAAPEGAEAAAVQEEIPGGDFAEEPIGEFKCTNNQEESIVHLRFKVDAVVKNSARVSFRDANNARKSRVREVIERILRSATREDLNDPNLSTLKRLIKVEVNKVLESTVVTEAVIHDFSMIEQ
jgi:hypothetical protein